MNKRIVVLLMALSISACASVPVVAPPSQCPSPVIPARPVLLTIPPESPPSIIERIQALNFEAVMAYAARLEAILKSLE